LQGESEGEESVRASITRNRQPETRKDKGREKMGISFALIVMGVMVFLDEMDAPYGLKDGWPWVIVALGLGNLYKNIRSVSGWLATIVGGLSVVYYAMPKGLHPTVKTLFVPVLLIVIGLIGLWKFAKD
jgi:hypothetical protein